MTHAMPLFERETQADSDRRGRSPRPTRFLPGTPDKVLVLAERAARRQRLWHPDDARLETVGEAQVRFWRGWVAVRRDRVLRRRVKA